MADYLFTLPLIFAYKSYSISITMINGNRRFAEEPNSLFVWNGATHSSFFENIEYTPSNMMNNTIAKRSLSTPKTTLYDFRGLTFEYCCENATIKHYRQTNY